jgi:hypothetical protein
MKNSFRNMKIYSFIAVFLFIAGIGFGQQPSRIKPVNIVWIADGDTVSINDARKGIPMPNQLDIAVLLDQKTIGKMHGQKFEFKWFMQGPTRIIITNSFFEQVNSSAPGQQAYTISTGRGSLRKGWWKVQIIAYADGNMLSYDNMQEFWISLK